MSVFGTIVRDDSNKIIFTGQEVMLSVFPSTDNKDRNRYLYLSNDTRSIYAGPDDGISGGFGIRVINDDNINTLSANRPVLIADRVLTMSDFSVHSNVSINPQGMRRAAFRCYVGPDRFVLPFWLTPPSLPRRTTGDWDLACGLNSIYYPQVKEDHVEIRVEWRQEAANVDYGNNNIIECDVTMRLDQVVLGSYLVMRVIGE